MMNPMAFESEWFQFSFWSPILTVLALLMIGLLYFLAPVLGYTTHNRGLLVGSMWALLAQMASRTFKITVFFLAAAGAPSPTGGMSQTMSLGFLFPMLDSALFFVAMALFVVGLTSLRRDQDRAPLSHRSFSND